jgi:TolB-like protein/Flp pilus assembly protein TadD
MSFFKELKRRNVFRVGIAYAISAWVLIQAMDIFLPIFGAPEWVMKVLSLILLSGLPIVLMLAWAFELTPDGVKREQDVDRSSSITGNTGKNLNSAIIGLMAIAIAFLLYDKFSSEPTSEAALDAATNSPVNQEIQTAPEAEPNQKSIAVLPFDNRSRNADDEFFVEGIHDDLLTNLARIGSLKVISRTSMTKYKDTEMSIPDIAKELGVGTIMEAAVQRSGDTVRINVQLSDAQTDEQLWAEIFDREMTAENLFALQSEISGKIAEALKATLSPEEQQRINEKPTENLAAYNAYMLGRQLMTRRNSEDIDRAADEFQRAVDLDPGFALAWTSVAEIAGLQMQYSDLDFLESIQIRRNAADRALALNNTLGEAHLSKATVLDFDELYAEAEASYLRAIELSPGNATAHHRYAGFLDQFPQRRREALQTMIRASDLDPMSSIIQVELGGIYKSLGQYEAAERQLRRVMEIDPAFAPALVEMSDLMSMMGRHDEQVKWIQKSMAMDPGRLNLNLALLWAYMDLGDSEAMSEIRKKMEADNPDHLFTGMTTMLQAMYAGNYAASMEAAVWVNQRMGRQPFFRRIYGFLNNMSEKYEEARGHFEISDPGYFKRDQWRSALEETPEMACQIGWILLKTGDVELGNDLLDMAETYLVDELPQYIDHADRYTVDACYSARGRIEESLDSIETWVSHRHYQGWYFLRSHPQWEPLQGHPRFEAAMQQIQDDLAVQRANLAAIESAEAGP